MKLHSFEILASAPIDPVKVFESLRQYPVPILSDSLQRLHGCTGLHSLGSPVKLVGTALTVKTRPGDNLMIYKAMTMMSPGHVLVIDGGGDTTNALVGDLITQYASLRGCHGFVVDGAIRDRNAFLRHGVPCFARGISHRGPYKQGPGAVNVPVCIGGQTVAPGDYIVADEDGVLSLSPSRVLELLESARLNLLREQSIVKEIRSGSLHQTWLDAVLAPHGLT